MAHKYMNVVSVKKNGFNYLKTNKIMKQSAVEWLVNKLNLFNITKEEHYEILCQIELEAKEIFEQQIIDAANQDDFVLQRGFGMYDDVSAGQQYYNEQFKNK